jgi:hypothetical protein
MARAWNWATELQTVTTIGAAKLVAPLAQSGFVTLCFDIVRPFPELEMRRSYSIKTFVRKME